MMKIILLILLTICTLLNAEHPRYKPRGPPIRRRSPPQQQFIKKWHQGGPLLQKLPQGLSQGMPITLSQGLSHGFHQGIPQGIPQFSIRNPPVRQKPINLNSHNHIPMLLGAPTNKAPNKVPQGMQHIMQRPVTPPVRNFWKNPVNNVQFPPEKFYKQHGPSPPVEKQKPFRSAPSLPSQEYDYHIQTNQIPNTHISPIKQIGEKGPIHTIPAPNLSLKDKPKIIEEVRNDLSYQHNLPHEIRNEINFPHYSPQEVRGEINFGQRVPQTSQVTIQKSHEYQVTEAPEHNQKILRAQQEHQRQIQYQIQKQLEEMQNKQNAQESQSQTILLASDAIPLQHSSEQNPSGDIILSNTLSSKDLYQLVNANYPQQTQQLEHIQLFQPEASFIEQFPQEINRRQVSSEKISFHPEYHSFNYDEQAHQKSMSKKDMSSLVSATYNLGSDPKEISSRNAEDTLVQSELIQNYFDTRSDVSENKIEPDAKPGNKKEILEESLAGTTYYSSLPNKEAAESLAQLQNAGKINSNLMKLGPKESKEPMTILIPDEDDIEDDNIKIGSKEDNKEEFGDYEDDENLAADESGEFGHRIQPKKRAE